MSMLGGGMGFLNSGIGQTLMRGQGADWMRRPPSGTNLPRTVASNAMAQRAPQQPAPVIGMRPPAQPNPGGWATMDEYKAQAAAAQPTPIYGEAPGPDLTRFVPFTGAQGQDMRLGAQDSTGAAGASSSPFSGLLSSLIRPSGTPGAEGDYRSILAQLFPMFRGEGRMMDRNRDYFQGAQQPSFQQQFGYLA